MYNTLLNNYQTEITPEALKESLALYYHENSKLDAQSSVQLGIAISRFLQTPYLVERAHRPFKIYPHCPCIDLSLYKDLAPPAPTTLVAALSQRRSCRNFHPEGTISLYALFYMLYHAYGVTRRESLKGAEDAVIGYRNIPSGGALYPLELYVLLLKGDIERGLYHFRADICALERIKDRVSEDFIAAHTGVYPVIQPEEVGAFILTTAVFARSMTKYGERGYRFILQEAGALATTMHLLCESIGLGACQLGGFSDEAVNDFLDIDGYHESIVNIQAIGVRPLL